MSIASSVRDRGRSLFILLAGLLSATPVYGLSIQSVSWNPSTVGRLEPVTVQFSLSQSYSNPYDPDIIDVVVEFTGPSSVTRVIPAFWAGNVWKARIAPLETGTHNCRIYAEDNNSQTASYNFSFTSVASTARGFVKVDPRNPRHLAYEDGSPYFPVGHNLCWSGADTLFMTQMNKMEQAGENWMRYWVVPFVNQGLEWGGNVEQGTGLGRYSQNNSTTLDNVLEAARARGIQVQVCLDSFNGWNETLFANWDLNVYNSANGGMCNQPIDYFSNAQAKAYARKLLRYVVARWGYNSSVLCWEFFNEVDAVGVGSSNGSFFDHEQVVADWHEEMAQYLESIDPYDHLITTSFADDGPRSSYDPIWNLPEMDIVQVHQYHILLPWEHVSLVNSCRGYNKPIILGEANPEGPGKPSDSNGQSLHDMIWPLAMVQSGAMSWWWDGWIYDNNLYYRFEPLVAFLAGEDWAPYNLSPVNAVVLSGHTTVTVFGTAGGGHARLFLHDPFSGGVSNFQMRLPQLTNGLFRTEYWNTTTGTVQHTQMTTAGGTGLVLTVPNFARNWAMKVDQITSPMMEVTPLTLTPQTTQGGSPSAGSFTVRNIGLGTLSYSISDDATWLSVSPASGTSTGETDTITVNYSTASLGVGNYTATITISDPNAYNNPQTIEVNLTIASAAGTVVEEFTTMPSWSSTFNAGWGSAATWSVVSGGQSGNALQAVRSSPGSSARVKVYNILNNTNYTLSIYIRCPSGSAYWAETAYRLGSHTASDMDANIGNWTMIKKFSDSGTNGNGNTWTQYTANFNSGSSTQISVGYKLGSSSGTGPTVLWDTLNIAPPVAVPAIALSPASLSPACPQGDDASDQSFTVQNSGNGTLSYSISDNVTWLAVSPTSGTSTGEADNITVSYTTSGLTAGNYNATITVSDPNASNSPQTIPVSLTVNPPPPTIARSPASLSPVCTQGTNAANGNFTVSNSGGGTLSYSILDNATWLSVSPTGGTSTGENDSITVTYATSGLTAGNYNATITISDPNATNNPQTIPVSLTVNPPPPTIARSPASLSPSCTQGSNAANQTFNVSNSGGGTLSYSISDNVSWLGVSPASGTSTGESDTITVSYTTSGLSAGTYNGTITISDPNASNNPQTVPVTLTVNPAKITTAEDFNSLPSWSSSFDAGWGSAATWSAPSGGQSGNALQAVRSSPGSSAKVKVYSLTPNSSYTISVWIKCPSSSNYWAECAYKFGSQSASDFDNNGGTWTMVKKFDDTTNGNGNTWTQYSLNFNSGSNTQISVGFKLGSSSGTGPTVRWDTLRIQ